MQRITSLLLPTTSRTFLLPSLRLYSTAPAPTSAPIEEAPSTPAPELLPYFVGRTSVGGQLPVYSEVKNGGSKILTVLRKVDGDLDALRRDLEQYVQVESYTKPASRQVVIKGEWVKEVKEWLAARGF